MGAGNFYPSNREELSFEMFYLDDDAFYFEDEDEERVFDDYARTDAIDEIAERIRERFPSFEKADRWEREERVLLENAVAELRIADNQWSTAIFIIGKTGAEHRNLHRRFVGFAGDYLKRVLLENYTGAVYRRRCAWTCTQIAS